MSVKVVPLSVETCHCTVGVGLPEAAAVKVTLPAQMACDTGLVVTVAAVLTVSVAAVVVAVPHEFVNTARYFLALSDADAVNDSVVEVAPPMSVKLIPSVDDCHCTVGLVPNALAVNVAVVVAHAFVSDGLLV